MQIHLLNLKQSAAGVDNEGTKVVDRLRAGCVTDSSNRVRSFVFERSMYYPKQGKICTARDMRYVPISIVLNFML